MRIGDGIRRVIGRTRGAREGDSAFRGVELFLLVLAAGIALAAPAPLPLRAGGGLGWAELAQPLALIGACAALHVTFVVRGRGEDQVLLPIVCVLMGLSLALSQRLAPSPDIAARQGMWTLLACAAIGVVAHFPADLRLLRRYRHTIAAGGIALVALTLVAGRPAMPGGPRLWLSIGGVTFQPSELLKLVLVIYLAGYLAERGELLTESRLRAGRLLLPPLPYLAPLAAILGMSLVLLAAQGDLGAALLLFAIALALLYAATGKLGLVVLGSSAFAAGAVLLYHTVPIVRTRLSLWLDPWADPSGLGYQPIQALMALGAGGIAGTGLGFGMPDAIPAAHTDFVYVAIVEELGLAGGSALLLLYGLLCVRGYRIAVRAAGEFPALLAGGLSTALAVQTLLIIGGDLRLVPLTGITLPFLSHGGSSMLISAVSAGLLLRVSRGERG